MYIYMYIPPPPPRAHGEVLLKRPASEAGRRPIAVAAWPGQQGRMLDDGPG